MPPPAANALAADAYGVSAGLDLLSGVVGFMASMEASSAAQSRADLIIQESEANAQRYSETAAQFEAHEKMQYLGAGVKVAGSALNVLATTARTAHEDVMAIKMAGEAEALNAKMQGENAEMQGRNALLEGMKGATGMVGKAAEVWPGAGSGANSPLGDFAAKPNFGGGWYGGMLQMSGAGGF